MNRIIQAALVAMLFAIASPAIAADFFHRTSACNTNETVNPLNPGSEAWWCPNASGTSTAVVTIENTTEFSWNADRTSSGAGSITLTVFSCSKASETPGYDCKTPMFDGAPAVSGSSDGRFALRAGTYMIVASGTSANAVLYARVEK